MPATRLQGFMDACDIKPLQLAREAGMSRQALRRIRDGKEEPRLSSVAAIVRACRRLSRKAVNAADLFDLAEGPDAAPHHLKGVTERHQSLPPQLRAGETPLAAFCAAYGFPPARVAQASRLSINRVSAYLSGTADPRLTNVRKLCAGLALLMQRPVSASDIFDFGENDSAPTPSRKGRDGATKDSR